MLGIAVLFFLGLWLLITLWATLFGWRLGKKYSHQPWLKWTCATLGFFATMGWYISSEIYHFTKEQIWVTKFCEENPRLKIYITPEQLAEIIKTGDYSQYTAAQPSFKYIDEKYAEINGRKYFNWIDSRIDKVSIYRKNSGRSKNTDAITEYFVYQPYSIVLFSSSEAYSEPSGLFRLKFWYGSIRGCSLSDEDIDQTINSYLRKEGDVNE